MATKIDITKPVRTRSGLPVTLLTDKALGDFPIAGHTGKNVTIVRWMANGMYTYPDTGSEAKDHPFDLIQDNAVWVNIYSTEFMGVFPTKEDALRSVKEPIARVRVPYTPGQFD